MTRFAIALGSNLEDRLGHMRAGLAGLRAIGTVTSVSSLYETEPVGGPEQGRYLNAVAVLDTDLDPVALMERLIDVERTRRRIRVERFGPRTLDLDIVASNGDRISLPTVEIPHPRASERRFVLEPLAEVWPSAPVGDAGQTASSVLEALPRDGVFRWQGDWEVATPRLGGLGYILVSGQLVLIAAILVVAVANLAVPVTMVRSVIGISLALVGSWFVIGAALALGSTLSALPDPKPGGALVDRGPFRLVRHPIYGGVLLGSISTTVLSGGWWPLLPSAALALLLKVKAGLEERALMLAYPEFGEYCTRVRFRFLPFVHWL